MRASCCSMPVTGFHTSLTLASVTGTAALSQGPSMAGQVHFGTCGWSDDSIKTCGRFYPSWVRTSEQRLQHYSQTFPCVEVDSSTYAIPRPDNTRKWAASTPAGFKFHFKAFGLFTHRSAAANTLPGRVRHLVPADHPPQQPVTLSQLGPEGEQLVWDAFHAALEPVIQAGRMGCVVFQFQLSFPCSPQSMSYLEHCRTKLNPAVTMAVEFRNRSWFTSSDSAERLCAWLSSRGISLVSADELQHETFQKDREQRGLQPGQQRCIMPIALHVTQPGFHYVRVHRRHGTTDRILPQQEIQEWSQRIAQSLAPALNGPLYFLWGTDWEDAPIVNSNALTAVLPPELRLDWKAHLRHLAINTRGSIASMLFKSKESTQTASASAPAASPCADCSSKATSGAGAGPAEVTVRPAESELGTAPSTAASRALGHKAIQSAEEDGQEPLADVCCHRSSCGDAAQQNVDEAAAPLAGPSQPCADDGKGHAAQSEHGTQPGHSLERDSSQMAGFASVPQSQMQSGGTQGNKRLRGLPQSQPAAKKASNKGSGGPLQGQRLMTSYFGR